MPATLTVLDVYVARPVADTVMEYTFDEARLGKNVCPQVSEVDVALNPRPTRDTVAAGIKAPVADERTSTKSELTVCAAR